VNQKYHGNVSGFLMCITQLKMCAACGDSELFSLIKELVPHYWWATRNTTRLREENNFLYCYYQRQS